MIRPAMVANKQYHRAFCLLSCAKTNSLTPPSLDLASGILPLLCSCGTERRSQGAVTFPKRGLSMPHGGVRPVPRRRIRIISMKQMQQCPAASQPADKRVSEKQWSEVSSRFIFPARVNTGLQLYDYIALLMILGNKRLLTISPSVNRPDIAIP